MKIEKRKMRILCAKWKICFEKKFNKISRNAFRRICRCSNADYKKHAMLLKNDTADDKEYFIMLLTMREELKVMHKDGIFYDKNINFIKECAEIINVDDIEFIENFITFATGSDL